MNISISYKHMESSEAMDAKIREKTEKIAKYFEGTLNVKWICSIEAGIHTAEAEITGYRGAPIFASASSDNMYKNFDEVIQKISRQARKKLTRENKKGSELAFVS